MEQDAEVGVEGFIEEEKDELEEEQPALPPAVRSFSFSFSFSFFLILFRSLFGVVVGHPRLPLESLGELPGEAVLGEVLGQLRCKLKKWRKGQGKEKTLRQRPPHLRSTALQPPSQQMKALEGKMHLR